ncbi:MAG: hypothetical protein JSS66_01640 [Armatimonadetes bacterium]|nr:hypothetical protein [Armatimonadota bacterium]
MKRIPQIFAVAVASICLSAAVRADNSVPVQGTGEGHAISQNQIESTGTVRVGRDDRSVISTVTILSLAPGQGHTLVGKTTHTIDFGGGNVITTDDDVLLVPVDDAGLYQLLIKCNVVSGTGNFAGAGGQLTFSGRVNLATGQASWRLHGALR